MKKEDRNKMIIVVVALAFVALLAFWIIPQTGYGATVASPTNASVSQPINGTVYGMASADPNMQIRTVYYHDLKTGTDTCVYGCGQSG